MTSRDPAQKRRPRTAPERAARHRAAGIYGAIITASIMTAAGDRLSTIALTLAVVITLVVYWLAEQYAEILGQQATGGHLPSWPHIRETLAAGWPIVSASFAPLAALLIARLAGASRGNAANVGIAAAIVLLTVHGWTAGRAAQLHGWQLIATTAIAAVLGLVMVALKNLVLHLH